MGLDEELEEMPSGIFKADGSGVESSNVVQRGSFKEYFKEKFDYTLKTFVRKYYHVSAARMQWEGQ